MNRRVTVDRLVTVQVVCLAILTTVPKREICIDDIFSHTPGIVKPNSKSSSVVISSSLRSNGGSLGGNTASSPVGTASNIVKSNGNEIYQPKGSFPRPSLPTYRTGLHVSARPTLSDKKKERARKRADSIRDSGL